MIMNDITPAQVDAAVTLSLANVAKSIEATEKSLAETVSAIVNYAKIYGYSGIYTNSRRLDQIADIGQTLCKLVETLHDLRNLSYLDFNQRYDMLPEEYMNTHKLE